MKRNAASHSGEDVNNVKKRLCNGEGEDASSDNHTADAAAASEPGAPDLDSLRASAIYGEDAPDWGGTHAVLASERVALEAKRGDLRALLGRIEGATHHHEVLGIASGASDADKKSAYKRLALKLHPDKHVEAKGLPIFARIEAAFKRLVDAKDASSLDGAPAGAPAGNQRQRKADEARYKKAAEEAAEEAAKEAAAAKADAFHQEAEQRVKLPRRATKGMSAWNKPHGRGPNTVQFARVDASKVPKLGTSISTVGHGNVDLLPTEKNVLVIEAGCSAEKTRQVLAWIRAQLASDPKMPVIFLTTRRTHADDLDVSIQEEITKALAETLETDLGFKNYLSVPVGMSKTDYLSDATRCIVSEQSLHVVDPELYKGGVVVMDELRSLAAIPGGATLEQPQNHLQRQLRSICTNAKYRIAMDADISADGAAEAFLRIVAPFHDVLHLQLTQATLRRTLSVAFSDTDLGGSWQQRLVLNLLRARQARMAGSSRRVLVICSNRRMVKGVVDKCHERDVKYKFYTGITNEKKKRDEFRDTATSWETADVVIATTTLCVGVNVLLPFGVVFLHCGRGQNTAKLRELLQAIVRVGRNADAPLDDEHVYTRLAGSPPDISEWRAESLGPDRQQRAFRGKMREAKNDRDGRSEAMKAAACADAARRGDVPDAFTGEPIEQPFDDPLLELLTRVGQTRTIFETTSIHLRVHATALASAAALLRPTCC